jgi:hypothetical protein
MLSGCASLPAFLKIPVPVPCLKGDPPAKPVTMDEAAILKLDEYAATITVYYERLALKGYAEKAESVISACK